MCGVTTIANERELASSRRKEGHIVVKFSTDGKVLMTLGSRGAAGNPPDALTQPTSVVVAPSGDIFISEGHNQNPHAPPETVSRISKFTKDGKFIKSFGKLGSGPGEFRDLTTYHGRRTTFCCRPGNMRIQILVRMENTWRVEAIQPPSGSNPERHELRGRIRINGWLPTRDGREGSESAT